MEDIKKTATKSKENNFSSILTRKFLYFAASFLKSAYVWSQITQSFHKKQIFN